MQTVRFSIVLVFLVLLGQAGWSQPVSGYQGKRFLLKTDVIQDVFKNPNLELEWVAMREFSLALASSYTQTDRHYIPFGEDSAYSKVSEISLNVRKYKTGAQIAPVGTYFDFTAGLRTIKQDYFEDNGSTVDSLHLKGKYLRLTMALGVQRIFFRRLVLDANINYGIPLSLQEDGVRAVPTGGSLQSRFYTDFDSYVSLLYLVGASVKVGILLF